MKDEMIDESLFLGDDDIVEMPENLLSDTPASELPVTQTTKLKTTSQQVATIPTDQYLGARKEDAAMDIAIQRAKSMKAIRHFIFTNLEPKHFCYQGKNLYMVESGTAHAARYATGAYKILNKTRHDRTLQSGEPHFFYEVEIEAWLARSPLETIVEVGTASSRDSMWMRTRYDDKNQPIQYYLPLDDIPEDKVLKKAATNAFQRAFKRMLALNLIEEDELTRAGVDISKIGKIEYNKGAQGGGAKKEVSDKQWGAIAGIGKNVISDWDSNALADLKKLIKFSKDASNLIQYLNTVTDVTKVDVGKFIKGGFK